MTNRRRNNSTQTALESGDHLSSIPRSHGSATSPSGLRLYDIIGNVWERTADP